MRLNDCTEYRDFGNVFDDCILAELFKRCLECDFPLLAASDMAFADHTIRDVLYTGDMQSRDP